MDIKSQTKLGNFENFEEITDAHNQLVDDLWKLRHSIELKQVDLRGEKVKDGRDNKIRKSKRFN